MAVAAVGLSVVMIQLDEAATAGLLDRLSWVYTGGPEGARAVLSTIAASMIIGSGPFEIAAIRAVPARNTVRRRGLRLVPAAVSRSAHPREQIEPDGQPRAGSSTYEVTGQQYTRDTPFPNGTERRDR